jgi:eukaryotic-like serine/threonine-protein kinase
MELLAGRDLEAVVTNEGPLSPDRAVSYLRQTASGLDKAHAYVDRDGRAAPIVHRDLKPENLFLAHREDGSPCIKILDFGIAKVLGDTANVSQDVKGTPLFMAPEQIGAEKITPRTDVWALGLIGFYLLLGKRYWLSAHRPESSIMRLFSEVLALPLAPASARARELGVEPPWPPAFDDWFSRCVNRDASARFASAGEAVSALGRVFDVHESHRPAEPPLPAKAALPPAPSAVVADSPLAGTDAALALGRTAAAAREGGGRSRVLVLALVAVSGIAGATALVLMRRTAPPPVASDPPARGSVIVTATAPPQPGARDDVPTPATAGGTVPPVSPAISAPLPSATSTKIPVQVREVRAKPDAGSPSNRKHGVPAASAVKVHDPYDDR